MIKHTPGPLTVVQEDKWPFKIDIVDASGEVVFTERRHAYSTKQETVAEVMNGTCFDGDERKAAIEVNGRQVADAILRAAAPDLLSACEIGLDYLEAVCFNTPNPKKRNNYADAAAILRAAIAKATGAA